MGPFAGKLRRKSFDSKKGSFMTKVIDIKSKEQVTKISELACKAPY